MKRLDLVAGLLCLATLISAAYVSTIVFDRLPHTEDEIAFLFQARTLASGRIVAPAPALPDFFSMPFIIVRDDMWFGKYPPGYPLVLALGAASGRPWLLNPLFGALSVGLIYLAGRRLYGAPTGLLAAALGAASPFFLIQSGSFLSHVVSLFWALLLLITFESARRTGSGLAAAGAGLALGMLFLSRPLTAAGVAVPYAVWAGTDILRRRSRLWDYAPLVLGFSVFAASLLAYNQVTTGEFFRTGYELWWSYDRIGFGRGIGVMGEYSLPDGWETAKMNLDALALYLSGWPGWLSLMLPTMTAGLAAWRLISRRISGRRETSPAEPGSNGTGRPEDATPDAWDLLHAGTIVALILVYMAYWAAGHMYGPRYYFEAVGAIMLLSARAIFHLAGMISGTLAGVALMRHAWRRVPAAALILGAGLLTLTALVSFVPAEFARFQGWYGVRGSDLRAVQALIPHNALVFIEADDWPKYAPFFSQNSPTLEGEVVYALDLGPEKNAYLMEIYPGRAFFRFSGGGLNPVVPP